MKKTLLFLVLLLTPFLVLGQTASTYYTVPTISALADLTSRPPQVYVFGSTVSTNRLGATYNWVAGSAASADGFNVVAPTNGGATGRWFRQTGYSVSAPNGILTTDGSGVPSISSTTPANLTIPTPTISGNVTISGGGLAAVKTVNPTLTPTITPANTNFYNVSNITGTGVGNQETVFNYLGSAADNAQLGNGAITAGLPGSGTGILFHVSNYLGGAAMTGSRTALHAEAIQTATTGNTAGNYSYSGIVGISELRANDNGTGLTAATARGLGWGGVFISKTGGSATNLQGSHGVEIDMENAAGSSMFGRSGLAIVQMPSSVERGTVYDIALSISDSPGVPNGWKKGISFGRYDGQFPIDPAGALITGEGSGGSGAWGTTAYGIDFNGFTFTSAAWRSNGALIDGTGDTTFKSARLGTGATSAFGPLVLANSPSAPTFYWEVGAQTIQDLRPMASGVGSGIVLTANTSTGTGSQNAIAGISPRKLNGTSGDSTGALDLWARGGAGQINMYANGQISTGRIATFGTAAIVLDSATTIGAALTYGGVTLANSVTGTGSMALSASPTFTGTVGAVNLTATGTVRANAGFSANGTVGVTATKTVRDAAGTGTCTLVFTMGLYTGGTC